MNEKAPQPERQFTAPGFDAKDTVFIINPLDHQEAASPAPERPEPARRGFGGRVLGRLNRQPQEDPNAFRAPDSSSHITGMETPLPTVNVNDLPRLADGRRDYSSTSLGPKANKPATWIRPLR